MELNLYDEFWFKVKIQSAKGVHAVACEIVYPPEILEAVVGEDGFIRVEPGTFFSNAQSDPVLTAGLEDERPGKLVVALNKMDDTSSSGAGSLFEVLFRCIGTGEGEIRFAQSRISDETNKAFPSQWASAKINVVGINLVTVDIVPRGIERKELGVNWEIAG